MNFLQCGQSDQESRPEPESDASRSRSRLGKLGELRGKAWTNRGVMVKLAFMTMT